MPDGMFEDASGYLLLLIGSALFSFVVSVFLLKYLLRIKAFQPYREQGPKSHFLKGSIPTGGGIVFILGLLILWIVQTIRYSTDSSSGPLWQIQDYKVLTIITFGSVILGFIGFADDLMKLTSKATIGLPARYKFILQLLVGAIASYLLTPESSRLVLPFVGASRELYLPLSIFLGMILFAAVINGVNFTDGLDGLAAGNVIISLIGINLLSVLFGLNLFTPTVVGIGLVLGFFVMNLKPAFIFMGDTGSYTLGAFIALLTISSGLHLYLFLFGIVYLIEVLSVILQVASFRLTGKRILLMSPIHHHFELKGWKEESIVVRFWLFQSICTALAVALAI